MKLFKSPKKWLEYFYEKYQYNYKLQSWIDKPRPWINYGTKEYENYDAEFNHREIFPDELFIDLDCDGVPEELRLDRLKKCADDIKTKLEQLSTSYYHASSGGKGEHIHVCFPELMNYNKTHRDMIKKELKKFFGEGHIRPGDGFPHVCMANPMLVQLEGARHRKGGIKIIRSWKDFKTDNKIPDVVLRKFEDNKDKYTKRVKFNLEPGTPKEIQFLEQEDFCNVKDGRARALFVLACYYSHFFPNKELFDKLQKWNQTSLNGYLSKRQIWSTINSIRKRKERPVFPHRYLNELLEELGFNPEEL